MDQSASNRWSGLRALTRQPVSEYIRRLDDVDFWRPFVVQVGSRHGLERAVSVRVGVVGTYPTFIASERWVVKFFGPLFEGAQAFRAERDANRLVASIPEIPAPRLLAEGQLTSVRGEWPWPYLAWPFVPGESLGAAMHLAETARLKIASQMGTICRALHNRALPAGSSFGDSWDTYRRFLEAQSHTCRERHTAWGSLPPQLTAQIGSALLPAHALIPAQRPPYLVHADLTRDHLLGQFALGEWEITGLIDFGDAMMGDLSYELGPLYFDLFDADPNLLAGFLAAYRPDAAAQRELRRKALSAALLHRFNLFTHLPRQRPQALQASTLEVFAALVWPLDSQGV